MRNILNKYPCVDYLHNALRLIADQKPDEAYEEICHAILKIGGELSKTEDRTYIRSAMTNKEAIEIIKMAIAEVEWNYPMDYAIAFEMAIKALEKEEE